MAYGHSVKSVALILYFCRFLLSKLISIQALYSCALTLSDARQTELRSDLPHGNHSKQTTMQVHVNKLGLPQQVHALK